MNDQQVTKTSTRKKQKKKGTNKGSEIVKEPNEVTANDRCPPVSNDCQTHQMPAKQTIKTERSSLSLSESSTRSISGKEETVNDASSAVKDVSSVQAEKTKAELKAERRALFEAQRAASKAIEVKGKVQKSNTNGVVAINETNMESKSKAELKAERRALQEAQRAAKATVATGGKTAISKPIIKEESKTGTEDGNVKGSVSVTRPNVQIVKTKTSKQKLFSHLPQYERNVSVLQAVNDNIHPAIVKLGLQYADGVICGSNARCVALIQALQLVISDFKTPKDKEISHALPEIVLDASLNFLEKCRNISVGMKNVSKKLREEIVNMDKKLTETEVKNGLIDVLQTFFKDNVEKAHEAIVKLAKDKITPNDVILTYGCSYVVKQVLAAAHKTVDFRVIVVDSRPKLEGRSMFDFLVKEGIKCSYILINAVSYAMREATKVLFGAHALLANGYVMSRVGSSQVALVAKAYNKPVLVCCETYKFCELVQTDSFVVNELGDKNDIIQTNGRINPLEGLSDVPNLNVLNLYYDVTPPDLITVVINDVCLVPCTSVPVLLRVKPTRR